MRKELADQKFGRLTVVEYSHTQNKRAMWLCKCDCGNKLIVSSTHLISGHTQSCGCLQKEMAIVSNTKHGDTNTRLYEIWTNIRTRVSNANNAAYKNYGGRGIGLCEEWNAYENFKEWAIHNGYSDNLTIDRINNDLGYSPDNCRWATMKEQSNNRRSNRLLTCNGKTHTISQWSNIVGLHYTTIRNRMKNGYSVEEALCSHGRLRRRTVNE